RYRGAAFPAPRRAYGVGGFGLRALSRVAKFRGPSALPCAALRRSLSRVRLPQKAASVRLRFCVWSGSSLSFLSSMLLFTGVGTAAGQTAPCKGRNVRGGASRLPQGQPL